jgi:hypothetical protein
MAAQLEKGVQPFYIMSILTDRSSQTKGISNEKSLLPTKY